MLNTCMKQVYIIHITGSESITRALTDQSVQISKLVCAFVFSIQQSYALLPKGLKVVKI